MRNPIVAIKNVGPIILSDILKSRKKHIFINVFKNKQNLSDVVETEQLQQSRFIHFFDFQISILQHSQRKIIK